MKNQEGDGSSVPPSSFKNWTENGRVAALHSWCGDAVSDDNDNVCAHFLEAIIEMSDISGQIIHGLSV